MKRLYAAISHHGLGHLAQTAPVLQALRQLDDGIDFLIRSALPRQTLEARLDLPFAHLAEPSDCNFVMHDALRIDVPASLAAYRAFHAGWAGRVAAEADTLARLGVDAVFSNVGYLPLAAAQRAGIPCMALCSLNWADIFAHYLAGATGADGLHAEMLSAYAGARAFLRPAPAMPMPGLINALAVPPIAQLGRNRRPELQDRLELAAGDRLVLIGMGGIPYRPPVEQWPHLPGVVWLVPDAWGAARRDLRPFGAARLPFSDLLASADALVTKPGYGSFVEAAAAGVPVLYLPRPDWPETPWLTGWLDDMGCALQLDEALLRAGALGEHLGALPSKPPVQADGAHIAARLIESLLQ